MKRLPAYGKKLMEMRRRGEVPAKLVIVTFDWRLAKTYPRVVLADDIPAANLDFSYLAGLPVQIAYRDKDAHRVAALVEEIVKVGPFFLATFAVDRASEEGARVLIIPFSGLKVAA